MSPIPKRFLVLQPKLIAWPFHAELVSSPALSFPLGFQALVLLLGLTALLCHAEAISLPASPTMLDRHVKGRSLESLKRAREVLETPLALRLDVLAGPARNKSYTTDPGVTQVCHDYNQPVMRGASNVLVCMPAPALLLGTAAPVITLNAIDFHDVPPPLCQLAVLLSCSICL